jgi:chemotaxis protein histidine kinase CheA
MTDTTLLQDFITEAEEHIEEMEAGLLHLEADPTNRELLNEIFRSAHTIKGSAEYLGMNKIAEIAHKLEGLLEILRRQESPAAKEICDVLMSARDRIGLLISDLRESQTERAEIGDILERIDRIHTAATATDQGRAAEPAQEPQVATPIPCAEEAQDDLQEIFNERARELHSILESVLGEMVREGISDDNKGRILVSLNDFIRVCRYMGYESVLELLETLKEKAEQVASPDDVRGVREDLNRLSTILPSVKLAGSAAEAPQPEGADSSAPPAGEKIGAGHAVAITQEDLEWEHEVEPCRPTEEEADRELFEIFADHLKTNLSFLKDQVGTVCRPGESSNVVESFLEGVKKLRTSANYMDYQELVQLYDRWLKEIEQLRERLETGEEATLGFEEDYFDAIQRTLLTSEDPYGETSAVVPWKQEEEVELLSPDGAAGEEDVEHPEVDTEELELGEAEARIDLDADRVLPVEEEEEVELLSPDGAAGEEDVEHPEVDTEELELGEAEARIDLDADRVLPVEEKEEVELLSPDGAAGEEDVEHPEVDTEELELGEAEARIDTEISYTSPFEEHEPELLEPRVVPAETDGEESWGEEREDAGAVGIGRRQEISGGPQERERAPMSASSSPQAKGEDTPARKEEAERVSEKLIKHTMRVDAKKIDSLMNQVGELVVTRALFSQLAGEMRDLQRQLHEHAELDQRETKHVKNLSFRVGEATLVLGRVANELQEGVMRVRMLPIAQLFNRYPRVVRDLVHGTNKRVRLEISGEDTELDKMVIEEVADPLVHLVRNSVDHGIESVEERRQAGKPPEGRLRLSAYHESNHVVIEVTDDGKGINPRRIRAVALEKNLLSEAELDRMTPRELLAIVMRPGFSTAARVTKTSGRGVGMDVVKKNVEKMNGTVEIESEVGVGTVVRIKIPLTLAIIQALLVRVGSEIFTIPLTSVVETLRIFGDDIATIEGMEVIHLRQTTIPLIRLLRVFDLPRSVEASEKEFVVIIKTGLRHVGLVVDTLIGEQEVVIKPLADYLRKNSGFSGATILGDGRVSLILDVYELVNLVSDKLTRKEIRKVLLSPEQHAPAHGTEREGRGVLH